MSELEDMWHDQEQYSPRGVAALQRSNERLNLALAKAGGELASLQHALATARKQAIEDAVKACEKEFMVRSCCCLESATRAIRSIGEK